MHIILDTNVFIGDLRVNGEKFKQFLNICQYNDFVICMPKIVIEELVGFYESELSEKLKIFQNLRRNLNRLITSPIDESINIDIKQETVQYRKFILSKMRVKESEIIPYNSEYLDNVINRAIKRQRPCSDSGEEIRDAVLWLSVLDTADKSDDKAVIFISNNSKQFCDTDKSSLHDDLKQEAEERNVKVQFFKTISDLLSSDLFRGLDSPDLTSKWIIGEFSEESMRSMIDADFSGIFESDLIKWASINGLSPYRATMSDDFDISMLDYEIDRADEDNIRVTYICKINRNVTYDVYGYIGSDKSDMKKISYSTILNIPFIDEVEVIYSKDKEWMDIHSYGLSIDFPDSE